MNFATAGSPPSEPCRPSSPATRFGPWSSAASVPTSAPGRRGRPGGEAARHASHASSSERRETLGLDERLAPVAEAPGGLRALPAVLAVHDALALGLARELVEARVVAGAHPVRAVRAHVALPVV